MSSLVCVFPISHVLSTNTHVTLSLPTCPQEVLQQAVAANDTEAAVAAAKELLARPALKAADYVAVTETLLDGTAVAAAAPAVAVLAAAAPRLGARDAKGAFAVDKHMMAPLNRLLRRAAHADAVLCGRVQVLLARLFPAPGDARACPAVRVPACATAAQLAAAVAPPVPTLPLGAAAAQAGDAGDAAVYAALWATLGATATAHSVTALAAAPDGARFAAFAAHCRATLQAFQQEMPACAPLRLDASLDAAAPAAHPALLKHQLADTAFVLRALLQLVCALRPVPRLVAEQHAAQRALHERRAAAAAAAAAVGPVPAPLVGAERLAVLADLDRRAAALLNTLLSRVRGRTNVSALVDACLDAAADGRVAARYQERRGDDLAAVARDAEAARAELAQHAPRPCRLPARVRQEHLRPNARLVDMCAPGGAEHAAPDRAALCVPDLDALARDTAAAGASDPLSTWKRLRLHARQHLDTFSAAVDAELQPQGSTASASPAASASAPTTATATTADTKDKGEDTSTAGTKTDAPASLLEETVIPDEADDAGNAEAATKRPRLSAVTGSGSSTNEAGNEKEEGEL